MGHRARRLFARRLLLDRLLARTGRQPGVSLGRRRPAGNHRPSVPALFRPGDAQRTGPDPQGTALRSDRPGGKSRRGRQGMLLPPRFHAHAFLHAVPLQVSPSTFSLRTTHRREPSSRPRRTRVRASRHGRAGRAPLFRRGGRVRQAHAQRPVDPPDDRQPRPPGVYAGPVAHALVPQHVDLGLPIRGVLGQAADSQAGKRHAGGQPRDFGALLLRRPTRIRRQRAPVAVHREPHQRPTAPTQRRATGRTSRIPSTIT